MEKIKRFVSNYWITVIIIVAALWSYKVVTDKGMLDPFIFSKLKDIVASFKEFWPIMIKNMFASFSLLFPITSLFSIFELLSQ